MGVSNIQDIKKTKPLPNYLYFLDANIWIYAMNMTLLPDAKDKGNIVYTRFFQDIVNDTSENRAKIVMCSILVSEILNVFLKKYAMVNYLEQEKKNGRNTPTNIDYKTNYRKTNHFKTNYALIRDEIKNYSSCIVYVDDSFNELKPEQILKSCPDSMDFNDYYYLLLCEKLSKQYSKFFMVTNDGDFKNAPFQVLSSSAALLNPL